ncbi:hypothetical Protein YC6258_04128 [Gynuella sunshinyii YC6258]|uniref:Uncharacterized protein n=1 Tax=Gynuella sunshinyii YC6258 TaxID=1445510 RepID=A0A0C5W0F1_9GAMM|nr:hypothetical Protein YC6258_04128 [Gynuella sunshinyii YC6258]
MKRQYIFIAKSIVAVFVDRRVRDVFMSAAEKMRMGLVSGLLL